MRLNLTLQRVQVAAAIHIVIDEGEHRAQAALHRFKNSVFANQDGLLRHKGDANALLDMQMTIVCMFHAPQDFQKRRLACAVTANQSNAFNAFERKVRMIKQCDMAKSQ